MMNKPLSASCIRQCKLDGDSRCLGCHRLLSDILRELRESEEQEYPMQKQTASVRRQPTAQEMKIAQAALENIETQLTVEVKAARPLIAILDAASQILAVNNAWLYFAAANGSAQRDKIGIGASYLGVCEGAQGTCDMEAAAFANGLKAVLNGAKTDYELVSPCHSPTEQRWFAGRVVRCPGTETPLFAVLHCNVTAAYAKKAA